MKTISVDGKNYVKASVIARELGYTADYVGQLCRAEKVDAQLVGRSWYVSDQSLREHKHGRYRSTHKQDRDTIKKDLQTQRAPDVATYAVPIQTHAPSDVATTYANKQFYSRIPKYNHVAYHDDAHDLIPNTGAVRHKTGNITVSLADAQNVKITSAESPTAFGATALPHIVFQGDLPIKDAENENALGEEAEAVNDTNAPVTIIPQAAVLSEPKAVHHRLDIHDKLGADSFGQHIAVDDNDEITNKIKVKIDTSPTFNKTLFTSSVRQQRDEVAGHTVQTVGGTLKLSKIDRIKTLQRIPKAHFVRNLLLAVFLGGVIVGVILTLQATLTFDNGQAVATYTFDVMHVQGLLLTWLGV